MGTFLWQNFLIDMKIRDFIVNKIKKLYDEMWCEALIEIGLGKGVLTKKICHISPNFFVIEYDKKLVEAENAKAEKSFTGEIIEWDVLEVDVDKILKERKLDPKKTLIVGNLPYYITSPIFRKFFGNWDNIFPWWVFMVQYEVGERISSKTNKKSFLWWLLNYWYEVDYLKWVPAKAFKPAPKVKSAVVGLIRKDKLLWIKWESLVEFLDLYNWFARKTIWKIEKMLIKSWKLESGKFKIPEELKKNRLEELDWKDVDSILN